MAQPAQEAASAREQRTPVGTVHGAAPSEPAVYRLGHDGGAGPYRRAGKSVGLCMEDSRQEGNARWWRPARGADLFACAGLPTNLPRSDGFVLQANTDHGNRERGPRLEKAGSSEHAASFELAKNGVDEQHWSRRQPSGGQLSELGTLLSGFSST